MKIGVVGAGFMGAEIALVFAMAGLHVRLNDRNPETLAKASERVTRILEKGVARGAYAKDQMINTLSNLHPEESIDAFSDREFVIEAVPEVLTIKQNVLATLDRICSRDAILASNTSTFPISTLAAALSPPRSSKFLGTHFFSPVSRMELVEVVSGTETEPDIARQASELLKRVGKLPIPVKDVPGFAVNRLLHVLLIEALRLAEEGVVTPDAIDLACRKGLGHPVGPFALMDKVGSGLCLQVQEILHESYGERFCPPALLKRKVADDEAGGTAGWGGALGA